VLDAVVVAEVVREVGADVETDPLPAALSSSIANQRPI
jgi:hypothetical protein